MNEPTRKCKPCGRTLPINRFHFINVITQQRESTCRDCKNRQARERYARNKAGGKTPPQTPYRGVPTICERCGQHWGTHPRCTTCTIGLGEGHVEGPGVLLDGKGYCGDCAAKQLRQRQRAA